MITRRKARSAAALEELYHDRDNDNAATDHASDTDDADNRESGSSHASETDIEDRDSEDSGVEGEAAVGATPGAPPRKRGRPAYLRSKSGHKWSLFAPKQPGTRQSRTIYEPATKGDAVNATTPVEAWNVLFTDNILGIIVSHTNDQINREIDELKEKGVTLNFSVHKIIDVVEVRAILGLLYYAGVHKISKSKTINWWGIHSMPLFKATMHRNRFTFILNCLRFDDKSTRNERKATDRFTHIREIWDLFIENCMNNYEAGSNVIIDEKLLSFRGRCIFKMYIPSEPDKYGLKIVSLNDSKTHYMINAIPYYGNVSGRDEGEAIPTYYVRNLSQPIHNTERNITCENWFTSFPLLSKMKNDYNLTVVETVKKNKR